MTAGTTSGDDEGSSVDDEYGRFSGPVSVADLERCFFLDDADLARVGRRRGDRNRIGFALQLGTVRYLGMFLADPTDVPTGVLDYVATQVDVPDPSCVKGYMARRTTRFEHAAEITEAYGYREYAGVEADLAQWIDDRSWTTGDGPTALFAGAVGWLRARRVLLPGRSRLERLVARIRDQATQRLHDELTSQVSPAQIARLEWLLEVPDTDRVSNLDRLRHGPTPPSAPQLQTISRRRSRRVVAGRTTIGVIAIGLMGLALTQLTTAPQTVEAASDPIEPTEGTPMTDNSSTPSPSASPTPCSGSQELGVSATEYLGLTESEALTNAEAGGLIPFVECRDGDVLIDMRPSNIDNTRLWLTIADGIVTNSYRG